MSSSKPLTERRSSISGALLSGHLETLNRVRVPDSREVRNRRLRGFTAFAPIARSSSRDNPPSLLRPLVDY
jgi:hypothetical protein